MLPNAFIYGKIPDYIIWKKNYILATKRPIKRDGIHFYNYYSLPCPNSYKSPVILDILCPKKKIPKLNNGHLEQAITVVLGPGDIFGSGTVGTGCGLELDKWIKSGDNIELEIEQIGILKNKVGKPTKI